MNNSRRMMLDIFWMILGVVLMVLTYVGILEEMYTSMGAAFFFVGLLNLGRSIRYLKDSAYKEKVDVAVQDERNRYIRMKAWSWAGYLAIIANGVLAIYFMVTGQKLLMLFASYTVCLILLLYAVCYFTFQKKN